MRAPDWVVLLARDWGGEMRRLQKGGKNIRGTLGRVQTLGPNGAAIRGQAEHVPDIDFNDEEVAQFHRAWLDLDGHLNRILALDFIQRKSAPKKWGEMNMGKDAYYRFRKEALIQIVTGKPLRH